MADDCGIPGYLLWRAANLWQKRARAVLAPAPLPEVTPIPIRFDAMSSIEDVDESAEATDDEPAAEDDVDSGALTLDDAFAEAAEAADDADDDDSASDDIDDGEPEGELENLLARPSIPGIAPPPQAEVDTGDVTVIDDLAEPWLDDEGRPRPD